MLFIALTHYFQANVMSLGVPNNHFLSIWSDENDNNNNNIQPPKSASCN